MRGGAGRTPLTQPTIAAGTRYKTTQDVNAELFQIFSDGINNIVLQLKNKLGNDIEQTNINAREIMNVLNTLSGNIQRTSTYITNSGVVGVRDISITKAAGAEYLKGINEANYYQNVIPNRENIKNTAIDSFTNLNINPTATGRFVDARGTMIDEVGTDATISNRLINCQNLEVLYLIKHDELMTTFAFTLNLFDKYKYSTKVILVLLKFLVTKNNIPVTPGTGCDNIMLPKPLITNIKKLLTDQEIVQDVIKGMKNTIMEGKNMDGSSPNVNFDRLRNLINPASERETSENDNLDANLTETPVSSETANLIRRYGDPATVTANTTRRAEEAAAATAAAAARRGRPPP